MFMITPLSSNGFEKNWKLFSQFKTVRAMLDVNAMLSVFLGYIQVRNERFCGIGPNDS